MKIFIRLLVEAVAKVLAMLLVKAVADLIIRVFSSRKQDQTA